MVVVYDLNNQQSEKIQIIHDKFFGWGKKNAASIQLLDKKYFYGYFMFKNMDEMKIREKILMKLKGFRSKKLL